MNKNTQYAEELKKAQDALADIKEREDAAIGETWSEVRKEVFSTEEISRSDLRVALVGEIITARKEKGISQKELEELSGVRQPIIARMESGNSTPNISTVLKVLAPLGKTLYVGDLKQG